MHDKKLDQIGNDITEIKVTLAVQGEQLKEHMKRSDQLEKRVEQVDRAVDPIRAHVIFIQRTVKIIGVLGSIAGIVKVVLICLGK